MVLPEDNVSLGPVERSPVAEAPLEGSAHADADLRMAALDLVENGHWPGRVRFSTMAPPRCPKPRPTDLAVGDRAARKPTIYQRIIRGCADGLVLHHSISHQTKKLRSLKEVIIAVLQ
jgi:hypothetical protein